MVDEQEGKNSPRKTKCDGVRDWDLLPELLAECARGRWGLFGQNSRADPEDRYWPWPEAKHLRELAYEIRLERSNAGEVNPLVEGFLTMCGAGSSNVEGEPKLASRFLEKIQDEADPTGRL